MNFLLKAGMAFLSCAAAAPLLATEVPMRTEQSLPGEQALELAELYLPEATIRREGESGYRLEFKQGFDKDPASAKLEESFPGLYRVALDAGLAALTAAYDQYLPGAKKQIASVFDAELTSAQRQKLILFYKSPTGRKTVDLVVSTADTSVLADRMEKDTENFAMSRADIGAMLNPNFLGQMSKDEIKELAAFSVSPVGRRFETIRPRLEEIMVTEMNALVQSLLKTQQAAISDTVAEHISSSQEAKGPHS